MSNVSVDNRNGRSYCAQGDWNLVLQYFSKKGVLYYNDYDGWNYESKNPTYSSPL